MHSMITAEIRDYRNFLMAQEEDLINNKIKIQSLEEWQKFYEKLLVFEKTRRHFNSKMNAEIARYLKPTDDYLSCLSAYMKNEMNLCQKNNQVLTDSLAAQKFADVVTLVTYDSISRKILMLESVAKNDKNNSNLDYVNFVNNFGVNFKISKKSATIYENLLLKQIDLEEKYHEIMQKLIWQDENFLKVEKGNDKDFILNYEFYHSLNFEGKSDYLEKLLNKIEETKANIKTKVLIAGKEYEIPRFLKSLFLEYAMQKELIDLRINKRDDNFIVDNATIEDFEANLTGEEIDIALLNIPEKQIGNLKMGEATAKLVETIENIYKIMALAKNASKKEVITYKDKENVYVIPKKLEQEFLNMYALKQALEKKNNIQKGSREIKNKINFLKEMTATETINREIKRLTYFFKKEKQTEKLEFAQRLDYIIKCDKVEVKEFYKKILMNIPAFLHSKKISDHGKIVYLKRMKLVIKNEEPEIISLIDRALQSLEFNEEQIYKIEDIRKSKNIEKLSNMLKKIMPFVNNSLIFFKNNCFKSEDISLSNDMLLHIDNLVAESKILKKRVQTLKTEIDSSFMTSDLQQQILERRNMEEIASLRSDYQTENYKKSFSDLKEN